MPEALTFQVDLFAHIVRINAVLGAGDTILFIPDTILLSSAKAFLNPLIAAERGFIEDVIVPSTTRRRVIEDLQLLKSKEDNRAWRKHGCGPL